MKSTTTEGSEPAQSVPAALYTVKLTCGIDMTTAFEPSELAK